MHRVLSSPVLNGLTYHFNQSATWASSHDGCLHFGYDIKVLKNDKKILYSYVTERFLNQN